MWVPTAVAAQFYIWAVVHTAVVSTMVDRDFRDAIGLMKGWSEASSPPPTMLIPLCDGVAYGMGHVKLQPEEECVTVHLGEDFFTQCSVADAASVVASRRCR